MRNLKALHRGTKASKFGSLGRVAFLVAGAAIFGGCVAEPTTGEDADQTSTPVTDDAADFCDDQNPCTKDLNCTPCSSLPESERDIYHCTPDADLPAACALRTGCVHIAWTTPAAQTDDCFPVVDADDLRSGVCRAGRCESNPS